MMARKRRPSDPDHSDTDRTLLPLVHVRIRTGDLRVSYFLFLFFLRRKKRTTILKKKKNRGRYVGRMSNKVIRGVSSDRDETNRSIDREHM